MGASVPNPAHPFATVSTVLSETEIPRRLPDHPLVKRRHILYVQTAQWNLTDRRVGGRTTVAEKCSCVRELPVRLVGSPSMG